MIGPSTLNTDPDVAELERGFSHIQSHGSDKIPFYLHGQGFNNRAIYSTRFLSSSDICYWLGYLCSERREHIVCALIIKAAKVMKL